MFKYLVNFFLIFTLSAQSSPDQLFQQANDAYKKGNYDQASALYQQIPNKSSAVLYNLGNCFYKQDKFGPALVQWRRAQKDWGLVGRGDLTKNIELLKKRLLIKTQSEKTFVQHLGQGFSSITSSMREFINSIRLSTLQILFLFFWIGLFAYLRFLYRRRQTFILVILVGFLAVSASMLVAKHVVSKNRYGVVIKPGAPLLSGPGSTFTTLINLPEAQEASILKQSGDFYKVKVNHQIGWMAKELMEEV